MVSSSMERVSMTFFQLKKTNRNWSEYWIWSTYLDVILGLDAITKIVVEKWSDRINKHLSQMETKKLMTHFSWRYSLAMITEFYWPIKVDYWSLYCILMTWHSIIGWEHSYLNLEDSDWIVKQFKDTLIRNIRESIFDIF